MWIRLLPLLLIALPAYAETPLDLDSPTHLWMEQQHSLRGGSCCQNHDGHLLEPDEWRSNGKQYEVRINGEWIVVPDDVLRDPAGGPNPTNSAIIWFTTNNYGVMLWCFSPGSEL